MSEGAIRRLRLGSGLVLFVYIALHLINHALGAVSLAAAEAGLRFAVALWHSAPGTVLLYGAVALHFALALRTVFLRRHWKLPLVEIVRLGSGFTLPLLLISHVVGTRLQATLYDVAPSYGRTVSGLILAGNEGWQLALLAPGWIHGSLGLWITLRRFKLARRARALLFALMIAMPMLAAFGFFRMASEAAADLAALRGVDVSPEQRSTLASWQRALTRGYLAVIALTFLMGQLRYYWLARRRDMAAP